MECSAHRLLESATHRTLHAHSFGRSSTQASLLLTDLLSRYLILLTSTAARYAEHSGRRGLTARDAFRALEEMGVSSEELRVYGEGEGGEYRRYVGHVDGAAYSARRREDLGEFRVHLAEGLACERDAMRLAYAPCDDDDDSDADADADDDELMQDIQAIAHQGPFCSTPLPWIPLSRSTPRRAMSPTLPLSPISNPDTSLPPKKRLRTDDWNPPEHIPHFLPPFPAASANVDDDVLAGSMQPPPTPASARRSTPLPFGATLSQPQQPQGPMSITPSSSDYLTRIPYSQSSLASTPEWHLPKSKSLLPPPVSAPLPISLSTPQALPSLLKAYHHILTHRTPQSHPATAPDALEALQRLGATSTPQRHKATMTMLALMQNDTRWEPKDLVMLGNEPRTQAVGPTFPVPIGPVTSPSPIATPNGIITPATPSDATGAANSSVGKLPQAFPRPVTASMDRTSRLPDLSRYILSSPVYVRSTRLGHPPVLVRGERKLVYGPGVPAPWNSLTPVGASGSAQQQQGGEKGKAAGVNGVIKSENGIGGSEKVNGQQVNGAANAAQKPVLQDAMMYATWDYSSKSYREPLRRAPGAGGTTIMLRGGGGK